MRCLSLVTATLMFILCRHEQRVTCFLAPRPQSTAYTSPSITFSRETQGLFLPSSKRQKLLPYKSSSGTSTRRFTLTIEKEEPQSVGAATFSLIKAIVGSGVLAMPAGLAIATDAPKAVIPATLFIMLMGMLSAYTFFLIGRMSSADGCDSLPDLWKNAFGKGSGAIVTLCILLFTMGASLAYSIVLGDAFSSLAKTVGLQGWLASRQTSILAVTLTALWPLCNLNSLQALAPFSVVGVLGTIVTCLFMLLRCVQGSYRLPDGVFLSTLAPAMMPSFGTKSIWDGLLSPASLVLASMCNCAFMAHYSAPDFLQVLGNDNDNNSDGDGRKSMSSSSRSENAAAAQMTKFKRLVMLGFSGVFCINAAILCTGFLTFGGNCNGIVLNNYSTADVGATVCRLLMALCVVGGFPFLITASRQTLFELMQDNNDNGNNAEEATVSVQDKRKVTRGLVSLITGIALLLEDAGVVVSLNGAVVGSVIIYTFPALIFLKSTKVKLESGALEWTKGLRVERLFNKFLVGFGVVSALMGGGVTIVAKYFPQLLFKS